MPTKPSRASFSLVVMVAKSNPHLVSNRPFLDTAYEDVHVFFLDKGAKLQWVRVVNNDSPIVGDLFQFLIVFFCTGLGPDQYHLHVQEFQCFYHGKCLKGPAHVNSGLFCRKGPCEIPEASDRV